MEWMKFKAVPLGSGEWMCGITGILKVSEVDVRVYCGASTVLIKPETLCRFVTHVPSVGDLYEGDLLRREYIGEGGEGLNDDVVYQIAFNNSLAAWVAIGEFEGEGYNAPFEMAVGFYLRDPKWRFTVIGNIHDPS